MSNFATPWTEARQTPLSVGILQTRVLKWVLVFFSRGSSQSRDQTHVSHIAGRLLTVWATREDFHVLSACSVPSSSLNTYICQSYESTQLPWSCPKLFHETHNKPQSSPSAPPFNLPQSLRSQGSPTFCLQPPDCEAPPLRTPMLRISSFRKTHQGEEG